MRILVAYGPRAGNTRAAATELAAELHADLDLILAREPREGVLGWLRNAIDNTFDNAIEIARPARKIEEYDLVVIGAPTSNGSIVGPVRTFLDRYGVRAHALALFVMSSGRGGDRALDAMTTLAHKAPVGRLVLHDEEVQSGAWHERIVEFAQRLAHPQPHAAHAA